MSLSSVNGIATWQTRFGLCYWHLGGEGSTNPTDANIPALQRLVAAQAAPHHRQQSPWRRGQLKQDVPVSTAVPSPYTTGKLLDWPKPRPSPSPAAGPLLIT